MGCVGGDERLPGGLGSARDCECRLAEGRINADHLRLLDPRRSRHLPLARRLEEIDVVPEDGARLAVGDRDLVHPGVARLDDQAGAVDTARLEEGEGPAASRGVADPVALEHGRYAQAGENDRAAGSFAAVILERLDDLAVAVGLGVAALKAHDHPGRDVSVEIDVSHRARSEWRTVAKRPAPELARPSARDMSRCLSRCQAQGHVRGGHKRPLCR